MLEQAEVEILRLAAGGAGVARLGDGRVCFVRAAAPGDRIRIQIVRDHGRYVEAEIAALLRPGPERVVPRCPHFGRCGGCDWQQLTYTAQIQAKTEILRDTLARLSSESTAATVRPCVPAPDPWHYRARARVALADDGALGFYAAGTRDIVRIDDCATCDGHLWPALQALPVDLRRDLAAAGVRQLVVRIDDTGALDLTASPETADAKRDAVLADRIYRAGGFAGVRVGNTQCGHKAATLRAGGLATSVPLGSFSQVNRAANERLVSYVVDRAGPAGVLTVDLFAGSGNLSLPLAAAGHNVVGLDSDRKLLAAAASAARRAGISARCTFFPADLRRWGPWAIKNSAADIVVLDPPRSGAAAVAAALGRKLVPRRVVYVSCDPATLARDLARCTAQGYRCMEIQPFDFFPQTAHIEAVAILERTQ